MKRGKLLHILQLESSGRLCLVDFGADGVSEVSSPLMSSDNCQDFMKTPMLTQESLNKISSEKTALVTYVSDSQNYSCRIPWKQTFLLFQFFIVMAHTILAGKYDPVLGPGY